MTVFVQQSMPRRPDPRVTSLMIDLFNARHPIGTRVRYWKGARGVGHGIEAETTMPAVNMRGRAVVKVPGDIIALTHVEVLA